MVSDLFRSFSNRSRTRTRSKSKPFDRNRRLALEPLERRQLLSSLGIDTSVFPKIKANDSYSYSGPPTVSANPFEFQMSATAFTFQSSAATAPVAINNGVATVDIKVDASGNLIGGNGSPFDFVVTGTINGVATTSPLLEGNILQFASQYNGANPSEFDFRFVPTGGSLTQGGASAPYPLGKDIGVVMTSDKFNTFTGDFTVAFSGNAKVTAVPITALPVSLYGYKFNDVNDNGADNGEPRLSGWTINLAGTDLFGNTVMESTVTGANGEYFFTGLVPGTYTVTEVQQTGWIQTTGGTTVTLTSGQVAVAVSGEAGTLPPGGTQIITPLLAFGNFNPTSIVIGMDKSPATPQSFDVFDPISGNSRLSAPVVPYGNTFQGGVRVATGDLNGNGFDDIITAPGRGASPPVINIYDQFGTLLTSFAAYPPSVNGGLQIAVADLNGDGLQDIVTVPSWGQSEVRAFYNHGVIGGAPVFSTTPDLDFLAFPSSFVGGAVVAASNLGTMGNGVPQIIVGSGAGMAATVEVFNVNSIVTTSPPTLATPTATFMPFNNLPTPLQGGVSLAVAQLTSTPNQSIVVGAGTGGQSLVNIFGWDGVSTYQPLSASGVTGFPAFPGTSENAPVQVAVITLPNGIATSIVTVQGAGATATNVHQLDILGVSPLVLSSPIVSPVPFSGPSTIAVINNLQPGVLPVPGINSVAKPASAPATTAAAAASKPAITTTLSTAATVAAPKSTTTSTTTTAAATTTAAKPATTTMTATAASIAAALAAAVLAAKPATTTTVAATATTTAAKPATTTTATTAAVTTTAAKPATTTTAVATTAVKPATTTATTTTVATTTAKPATTPVATTTATTTTKPAATTTTTTTVATTAAKPATTTASTTTAATAAVKPATTTTAAAPAAVASTTSKTSTLTAATNALLAAILAATGKK
jgi:hypothetical protein